MKYAYTIVFVYMFITSGVGVRSEYWPNVGTVLFTRRDLQRGTLEKNRMALLQARLHFQALVPQLDFVSHDEDYVHQMLTYFRDAYTCIKKEAPDAEVDKIMTTALSDAVGGYMKLYMLPVTKVYYYGGIVNFDDAARVLSFFTEVKKYLATNGTGWRDPDQSILNSIVLTSPRLPRKKERIKCNLKCLSDPCNNFAYLEKTNEGLEIPMPSINWEDRTMFMPFKNETTFALESPKYINTLDQYFNNAKCCVHHMGPTVEGKFDEKFQNWLSSDVVPHLGDDRLYVALGSVLSLVNKTKAMCDTIIEFYEQSNQKTSKKNSFLHHIFSSKTIAIITIILFLEFIWCACAFRNIFSKKRKGNVCLEKGAILINTSSHDEVEPPDLPKSGCCTGDDQVEINMSKCIKQIYPRSSFNGRGIKLSQNPHSKRGNYVNQHPKVGIAHKISGAFESTNGSINNFMCGTFSVSSVECTPDTPQQLPSLQQQQQLTYKSSHTPAAISLKPSRVQSKREPPTHINTDKPTAQCLSENMDPRQVKKMERFTLYKQSHTNINDTTYTFSTHETIDLKKEELRFKVLSGGLPPSIQNVAGVSCPDNTCLCVNCLRDPEEQIEQSERPRSAKICMCDKAVTSHKTTEALTETQALFICADKETETTTQKMHKGRTFHLQREVFVSKSSPTESKRHRKPYVEIEIEKPKNAEIKLGITGYRGQDKKRDVISKIPKKLIQELEIPSENAKDVAMDVLKPEQTTETLINLTETAVSGTAMNDQETAVSGTAINDRETTVLGTAINDRKTAVLGTAMDDQVDTATEQENLAEDSSIKIKTKKRIVENRSKDRSPAPSKKPHGILKYNKNKRAKITDQSSKEAKIIAMCNVKAEKKEANKPRVSSPPRFKRKSYIPKLKKPPTLDDNEVQHKKDKETSSRLNVTL